MLAKIQKFYHEIQNYEKMIVLIHCKFFMGWSFKTPFLIQFHRVQNSMYILLKLLKNTGRASRKS